ncbi:MAG: hypothetical protein IJ154_04600 [Bacteroidales bacterium]|nr:hypothetical protein [Bacteroidales bacterium]
MKKLSHFLLRHQAVVIICCLLASFTACNENHDKEYKGAELTYFGFDSFPAFADYRFYIDNIGHRIFNLDSFPYRARIDSMFPKITAVTSSQLLINGEVWNGHSCLDWSNSPVSLVNVSSDKNHTATYEVFVNVHRLDPDSMQTHIASHAYPPETGRQTVLRTATGYLSFFAQEDGSLSAWSSADAGTWTALPAPAGLSGQLLAETFCSFRDSFYLANTAGTLFCSADAQEWKVAGASEQVLVLFGSLNGRKHLSEDALIGIVLNDEGKPCFARYDGSWEKGDTVPDSFPMTGFASTQNQTVTGVDFYLLTGGLTTTGDYAQGLWSTMDGLYWARLMDKASEICRRNEACLFYYDGRLFLFGGEYQGKKDPRLYVSKNHGLTWEEAAEKQQFQAITEGISGHRILVDDTYIRIFGGKSGSATGQVWMAYINRLLF